METKQVTITEDTPDAWDVFGRETAGFVPDPMILRSADMFFMGRSVAGDRANEIWAALEKNVSGIITFFDALVTREQIPFINYWQTFSFFVLEQVLEELAVRVDIQNPVYHDIHEGALKRLEELHIENLPAFEVEQIEQELGAFDYDWQPDLGTLVIPPTHVQTAQFLLGGLIFGAYAAVSQTDHLLQSKRSRIFLALSAPQDENLSWRYEKEQQLFDSLRQACLTSQHIHGQEYPTAPSVLPYLMSEEPRPANPRELLDKALDFRTQAGGKAYRQWFSALRKMWSLGIHEPQVQVDVEQVRKELVRHYGVYDSQSSIVRYDIGFDVKPGGIGPSVVLKDMPLQLPEWVRRWLIENVRLRRHGKMLLRLSIAQRNYENLVMGLKSLWNAA